MAGASENDRITVVLTARHDAGAGLHLITLTPPAERAAVYRAPGQYVRVHAADGGYFVLAGETEALSWELLVRSNGGASDALLQAPEGTAFEVSGPLGKGFPMARAAGRTLVVAVAGSAMAAARPILRERIARGECTATHVYLGVRSPSEAPLASEVAGWARAGARLVLCLSRPDSATRDLEILEGASRRNGYVQKVLTEDVTRGLIPQGALIFAAGPQPMLDEVRSLETATLEVVTNV